MRSVLLLLLALAHGPAQANWCANRIRSLLSPILQDKTEVRDDLARAAQSLTEAAAELDAWALHVAPTDDAGGAFANELKLGLYADANALNEMPNRPEGLYLFVNAAEVYEISPVLNNHFVDEAQLRKALAETSLRLWGQPTARIQFEVKAGPSDHLDVGLMDLIHIRRLAVRVTGCTNWSEYWETNVAMLQGVAAYLKRNSPASYRTRAQVRESTRRNVGTLD